MMFHTKTQQMALRIGVIGFAILVVLSVFSDQRGFGIAVALWVAVTQLVLPGLLHYYYDPKTQVPEARVLK
jgi:hypothetical protein